MFTARNVLSWATFFPLIGAALIVAARRGAVRRQAAEALVDDARARGIALVTSGLRSPPRIAAWRLFDPARRPGVQLVAALHVDPVLQHRVLRRRRRPLHLDGAPVGLVSFVATIASMPWWSGAKDARWPA